MRSARGEPHDGVREMKIILDRVDCTVRAAAMQCVDLYHLEYMYDGRKPGIRGCVTFSAHHQKPLHVYHTPTGNIVVRQGETVSQFEMGLVNEQNRVAQRHP